MAKLNVTELEEAGIPKRFWKLDLETYVGSIRAKKRIIKFIKHFEEMKANGVGMLLTGPEYSFKTFLATYVLKGLLVRNRSVLYLTIETLQSMAVNSTVSSIMSPNYDLVVLDDVNKPSASQSGGWQYILVRRAIKARTDAMLPFVICTQLSSDEFASCYGRESLVRILENSAVVKCASLVPLEDLAEKRINKIENLFR